MSNSDEFGRGLSHAGNAPAAKQYPVIHEHEARGNSRPVSHEEFQELARHGAGALAATEKKKSTKGLDENWEPIKDRAYSLTREPWGGATINSHTGTMIGDTANDVAAKTAAAQGKGFGTDRYGITMKRPGQESVSVPPNVNREQFGAAMDEARQRFPQIANRGGHLGVFHDADEGRIDIDPVLVVRTPEEVEAIGAATRAIGGAYHFASGNGYFPPHVKDE
jgi:hypothetical protein